MYKCGDCAHLEVCKYTDAGDGRCRRPQYFRDRRQMPAVVNISPNTRKAMERIERNTHGGSQR